MIFNYPWNDFSDIKFNNNELLNHVSLNLHMKKLYDNLTYLNSRPMIDIASTSTSGVSIKALSGDIYDSTITNKTITPCAFFVIKNVIDQSTSLSTTSGANITDSIKFKMGEFTTSSGNTSAYIQEIDFGSNTFSDTPFNFSLNAISTYSTITSTPDSDFLCYKYRKDYDAYLSFSTVSAQMSGINTPTRYAYIIYYNNLGDIKKIKWSAMGI